MSETIQNALSGEAWVEIVEHGGHTCTQLPFAEGQDRATVDNCGGIFSVCFYGAGPADFSDDADRMATLGYEAWLNSPQQRHALAALALYGQPFGPTREGYVAMRRMCDMAERWLAQHGWGERTAKEDYEQLKLARAEADKWDALLPPTTETPHE